MGCAKFVISEVAYGLKMVSTDASNVHDSSRYWVCWSNFDQILTSYEGKKSIVSTAELFAPTMNVDLSHSVKFLLCGCCG